jgi:hypothetical protein
LRGASDVLFKRLSAALSATRNRLNCISAAEDVGQTEDGAEQDCPIIVSEFNQPRLLHQPAEFDQMARWFASFSLAIEG